ncbi:hypothetical protein HY484_03770 [Candidatus Woesearchaeota archaeon]|nr:hypothetical protein [Candidatus Woesearchaeota archaeon]
MKKTFWILTFLLLATVVSAQTTNPFEKVAEPLGNVFDAAAKLISLEFVEKEYQVEALFRLFLFIIIFSVLHSVLKNTIGKQQNKILEEKAVNVISAVVALGVAIFLPIEFLFRGAVILLGFMTAGVAITIYWAFRIERKEENKAKGALIGAGLLLALFVIMLLLFSLAEDLPGFKIGNVQLAELPNFDKTQETFITFIIWSQMVIVIAFGIELVLAFIHYEGHKKIASYVPEGIASAPRKGWHFFGQKLTQPSASPTIDWLQNRIRTTGLAMGMLKQLNEKLAIWREAIIKGEYAVLKDASTYYINTINQLFAWDHDTLKRTPREESTDIQRILNRLEAFDSILSALLKHRVKDFLEDIPSSTKRLTQTVKTDAIKQIDQAVTLINELIKRNKQELTEEVEAEEREETRART